MTIGAGEMGVEGEYAASPKLAAPYKKYNGILSLFVRCNGAANTNNDVEDDADRSIGKA